MPIKPKHLAGLAMSALTALACAGPSFADEAARVLSVEGVSVVQRAGAQPRILGVADTLVGEDVINIGPSSHAIIEFTDHTQITLRPGTVFRMDALSPSQPDSLLKGLIKGGMRSAAFDARWCEGDCTKEKRRKAVTKAKPAARVVEMKGTVAARGGDNARLLVPGAAVYEREGVATGANSYAVLVFSDGSRISLAANSRLSVPSFQFDYARHTGSAVVIHHAGEAMIATGKIAKQGPSFYRLITPLGEVKPLGTLIQSVAGSVQQAADQGADTARKTGEAVVGAVQDTAGQAAQAALNTAITPILQTMSALMTGLRDNPPTTEAGWNELSSQMTQMSSRLHGALDEARKVGGSAADSDAFKTVVGLALAAEFEIYAVGASINNENGMGGDFMGPAAYATLAAVVAGAKASTYQSESLALVGLSHADLDRVSNNRWTAHTIIETEVGGYLASQGNAAANDFFSKAKAAADDLRQRAQQAEQAAAQAAAQAAEEAERRASDDAQRLADEARDAEREAARLAAEAEELRQRQREKLQEDQAKLKVVADAAKETGKAVVEAGQDAAVQAAQAALNAAVAPIMSEMARLMTDLRNNPPATEEAWNQMKSRLAELSSRLHGVLENTVNVTGAVLNSREYKSIEGLVMAADLEIYSVLSMQSGPLEAGGMAAFARFKEMVAVAKADPDQSERLALVGLSSDDLDRVLNSHRYEAHDIIQAEVVGYLTSQGNAAANDFFAQAQAAALALQERARQTEEAAARAAEEAAKRAAEKARTAKREAERLAAEGKAKVEQAVVENVANPKTPVPGIGAAPLPTLNPPPADIQENVQEGADSAAQAGRDVLDKISDAEEAARLAAEAEAQRLLTEIARAIASKAAISIEEQMVLTEIAKAIADKASGRLAAAGVDELNRAVELVASVISNVVISIAHNYLEYAETGSTIASRLPSQSELAELIASNIVIPIVENYLKTGSVSFRKISEYLTTLGIIIGMDMSDIIESVAKSPPTGSTGSETSSNDSASTGQPGELVVWDGSVEVSGRIVRKNELLRMAVSGELILGPSSITLITNAPRPDLVKVAPGLFADVEVVSGSMAETITKKFERYGEPADGEHTNRDERNSRSEEEPPDGYKERYGEPADGEHTNRDERDSRSEKEPPDGYKERYAYGASGTNSAPDLYVWVRDGVITLNHDGQQVTVTEGNAVVVTKDQMMQLDYVPNFMRFDQTPRPDGSGRAFVPPPFVMTDGSVAGNCVAK